MAGSQHAWAAGQFRTRSLIGVDSVDDRERAACRMQIMVFI